MRLNEIENGELRVENWRECKLGDICDVKGGKRLPKGSNLITDKTNHPYIRIRDMYQYKYIENNGELEFVSDETFKAISKYIVNSGDVIIAIVGNTIGLVSLIGKSLDKASLTENCVKLVNLRNCLAEFIYYYLTTDIGQSQIKSKIVGTSQPKLPIYGVQDIRITLPQIEEQSKIVNILSVLDQKIETNNQINKKLEEMAQAIFKQWFVDFEFPSEDGEPYKSSGGEMIESEMGMIPKGWEVKELRELCDILTKSEKPFENPEKIYEHFSLPACDKGKLAAIECGKNINSNKYKIDSSCILISKLNPNTKRIWDPWCRSENAICSTEFIVFKPKIKKLKPFCYEVINSDRFTEFLLANVTGSTGSRQRVQPKSTLNFKFVLPERKMIESLCNLIKPMHDKVKFNIQENTRLKDIRDILIPKLMSGEIRVPLNN